MEELGRLYSILSAFLGDAKNGFDGECVQFQFSCPHCVEKYGSQEEAKKNLEVNVSRGVFHCWKCSSEGDELMHGSIYKLIRMYGNDTLLNEYKEAIRAIRESELYKIKFDKDDFSLEANSIAEEGLELPKSYHKASSLRDFPYKAQAYLMERGITDEIISQYKIGYTSYDKENKPLSNRIIIPSYNIYGELNYWVGRDFMKKVMWQKYFNPKVERKDIVFNEANVQWDADITLVEGPFDHIVTPNSIPLLGKVLTNKFKLYWSLYEKANANINIFLDNDAKESAYKIYKALNHGRLKDKIRFIPTLEEEDPAIIFQQFGKKGILRRLSDAVKIKEPYLMFS